MIHDPQRRDDDSDPPPELTQGRILRARRRRDAALALLGPKQAEEVREGLAYERETRLKQMLDASIGADQPLLANVLHAMSDAHMWMHQAEHVRSQSFGAMLVRIPETFAESQAMLDYSLVLNTFGFVAPRLAPWIFAEDEPQRDQVLADYNNCCETLTPTYCMWIATEVSLLALHRRAFTHWTMGRHDSAYRDFYKLARLLRSLREPVERSAVRVPGTRTFLEGMGGMAEHHIGRIYRGQHAHRMALQYFERGSARLDGWEEHPEIGNIVKNSRWRLNLLVNEGKANYELGHLKRSLLCYAQGWRAFLHLAESEARATANIGVVEDLIAWLKPLVDDPELSRVALRTQIEPLVAQFETFSTPAHLRLLAADLVMRVGHILFILKLLPANADSTGKSESPALGTDHELALRCVSQALALDPASTLAASDLLRIRHENKEAFKDSELPGVALAEQWPSGSGRFEQAARITEYSLQRWLAKTRRNGARKVGRRKRVARELLGSFLAHTDSSNVKLAQVYRYLMRPPRDHNQVPKSADNQHTLDFLCLKRYSSFFPFLPRPRAFRALGGGYFVYLSEPGSDQPPFGIAIDPGPDFVENLYRCGYSVADIHMIIITHDHADHLASLDGLLTLMLSRARLSRKTFSRDPYSRLAIVGNESVCRRYEFFNHPTGPVKRDGKGQFTERKDAVWVLRFEEIEAITYGTPDRDPKNEEKIHPCPKTLRIERVRTWGHLDAHGYIAQGFLLSFGPERDRCAVLFTSDTGRPPSLRGNMSAREQYKQAYRHADGPKSLTEAVAEADVVVAHLSSVPLRELRELAGLESASKSREPTLAEFRELWEKAVVQVGSRRENHYEKMGVEDTEFLLRQIQYGFRTSAPRESVRPFSVSPLSDCTEIERPSEQHLYLTGLLEIAELMAVKPGRPALLVIGELREELGTFRTRIASRIAEACFSGDSGERGSVLTADIGLRIRLSRSPDGKTRPTTVLCTTCDLDNDLTSSERFHAPEQIREVCVKGEDEGVFYNCVLHDPRRRREYPWIESVERYDVFGE